MKLKCYLHLKEDLDQAIDIYCSAFNAVVSKRSMYKAKDIDNRSSLKGMEGKTYYCVLKLFGELNVMISNHSDKSHPPYGMNSSIIICFDKDKELFDQTYNNLTSNSSFKVIYDKDKYNKYGNQIACFEDIFRVRWILELDLRQ
jgi:uncharacterized glyoxalase superfamily protein PhnB